jgi:hypothetical protein
MVFVKYTGAGHYSSRCGAHVSSSGPHGGVYMFLFPLALFLAHLVSWLTLSLSFLLISGGTDFSV